MRLKVQCLTRVENQYIGSLANGTRASTVVAPPHPLASGEQVSIWGRWAEQRGGVARAPLPTPWVDLSICSVYPASL